MSSLPLLISQQFPEFIREDHPAFVAFVKAYYEWMNQQQPQRLTELVDIDKTVDAYVEHFKAALDVNGVDYNYINLRRFLKNSKQFFSAKGSEEAFKFLFNILYGQPSEIITPWEYVLIPSEGQWIQDTTVFVQTTKGSAEDLPGEYIDIEGTDGRLHRVFVKSVLQFNSNTWEVFLDNFRASHVTIGSPFISVDRKIKGTLQATTVRANVDVKSSGFEVGQLFNIDSYGGTGTIIKIKSVDIDGGITAVEIIAFGVGYNTNFTTTIFPVDAIQREKVSNINLVLDADNPINDLNANYNTTDRLNNPSEALLIVRQNYNADLLNYFQDATYAGVTVAEQRTSEAAKTAVQTGAVIRISIGAIAKYPGQYTSGKSLVSDLSYVQDSNYYQKFSYVTVIEQVFKEYADLLKKTIHPAGTKVFGRYQVTNNFPVIITIDPSLNIIERGEPFRDFYTTTDKLSKDFEKVLVDTTNASEAISLVINKEGITDSASITDIGELALNAYTAPSGYWIADDYYEDNITTFT